MENQGFSKNIDEWNTVETELLLIFNQEYTAGDTYASKILLYTVWK